MIFNKDNNKELSKQDILEKYLDGNLKRFLRRHQHQYYYERIYSRVLPVWKKQPGGNRIARWLKKEVKWPQNIKHVVNIVLTLKKHYGYDISIETVKIAYMIWDNFSEDEFHNYFYPRYSELCTSGQYISLNKRKAFKEQKARGFIHVNDFLEFDRDCSHVFSIIDDDYIYPMNFRHGVGTDHCHQCVSIHIAISLVGVPGHTRVIYGMLRKGRIKGFSSPKH